jgi:hypothetical protein
MKTFLRLRPIFGYLRKNQYYAQCFA